MCKHCEFLYERFNFDDVTPREYWLFTEMFVYLHNGKDYCTCYGKTDLNKEIKMS